jgi:DNA polymerase I-like protein with 3'-5' exonuclease and polymerase domains
MNNLLDLYENYWVCLGNTLTEMEREGIHVDKNHMEEI